MSLVPIETRKVWRKRTYQGNMLKLANLLELRQLVEDAEQEGQRVKMQMIAEAAEDFCKHPDTVRGDLATIRNYAPERLVTWLKNGVSFSHIETANRLQHVAKKTPVELLDACYKNGGAEGKTMTVMELEAFCLGETRTPPIMARVNWLFEKLGKLPTILQWDEMKVVRYQSWLDAGREFMQ